tara:strand:+ start:279 stop:2345 length:2067 start_codon:yes stop_codon:yes gene_type:complete
MSSLNVVLTSDKAQFQNYFSDPIILPKNASVTMTKANLVLPVFVQNILRVPELTAPERAEVCLQVVIDGIYKDITWSDLFTAYSQYENITQIEPTLSADKFFSGTYEFWTNNYVYLEGSPAAAADGDKPKISWVISRAITNAFLFYEATDCSEYEDISIGIGNEPAGDPNVSITRPAFGGNPAVLYNNVLLNCNKQTGIKLNVIYTPYERLLAATIPLDISAADDRKNFSWNGGTNTIASLAVVGEGAMACGNTAQFETNGGYIRCVPTLTGGTSSWGLSLEGHGPGVSDGYHPLATHAPDIIDIGVEYSLSSAVPVYRIIDGQLSNNVYDGAAAVGSYSSHFKPSRPICKFTNANDVFAISCKRGNIINGSYEYVFNILMGAVGATLDTFTTIYTARKTLNSSSINVVPIFTSSANQVNNIFTDIQYIQKSVDTIRQGASKFNDDYAYHDSVKIQPVLDGRNNQEINFWSAIGLHSYHQTAAGQLNQSTKIVTYDGTPLNKNIGWKTNYKDQDNTNGNYSIYWIGKNKLSDFYKFDIASETWVVRGVDDGGLAFLPKLLNVYLLNLTAKNYSGTYNNFQTIGAAVDTTNGEDRLVGTIPVDIEDTTAASELLIQYEPFNAYYRPLNNPDNYTINEFMVEVSFKDFTTDRRKTIDELIGIMKLEFNIKRGATPNVTKIMGMSGILPVI